MNYVAFYANVHGDKSSISFRKFQAGNDARAIEEAMKDTRVSREGLDCTILIEVLRTRRVYGVSKDIIREL